LIAASVMWAFSFGLIKGHLVAYDPLVVSFVRLAVSLLFFSPWLVRSSLPRSQALPAMGLGAVQFGLMYCLYIVSFRYLPAYAVALYTIFTPLYVIGICDLMRKRWVVRHTVAALLAVLGAALVTQGSFRSSGALVGIGLLQLSNLCFAAGQVGYRHLVRRGRETRASPAEIVPGVSSGSLAAGQVAANRWTVPEAALIGWMYLGATVVTALAALFFGDPQRLAFDRSAVLVLLYLGIIPTGLGFYLWNKGAVRVSAGALAAANNLKIPLAVLCSWLIFSESADYFRVMSSLIVIVIALFLAGEDKKLEFTGRAESDSLPS
jgi:drug/metabolite transporter (DMT)-like permease